MQQTFEWFSSTFQGRFIFQGLFKTVLYIQVLFKPVQSLEKVFEIIKNNLKHSSRKHHAREPLYSNSAVIAWCSQSSGAQNILFWFTVIHSMSQYFTAFNFHTIFFISNYCLGIVVHSGLLRAFKFKNQQSTSQFLASQLDFMCLKCVQWLINVLWKSSVIMLCHQIMKNTYKWRTRKFEIFLCIICEVASHFSSVRNFWVVKWTVPYVECLNILLVRIRQAVSVRSRWEHKRF